MSFLVSILNLCKWIWYYNGHWNLTNRYFHKCYVMMNLFILWPIQMMSNDCYRRCHQKEKLTLTLTLTPKNDTYTDTLHLKMTLTLTLAICNLLHSLQLMHFDVLKMGMRFQVGIEMKMKTVLEMFCNPCNLCTFKFCDFNKCD